MAEHTKEPWRIDPAIPTWIVASDDISLANTASSTKIAEQWEANASRIVACVNACSGIPTDELEPGEYEKHIIDSGFEIGRLQAQRDELLAALKGVVAISDRKHDAWDRAHAAIAKVEKPA